MKTNQVNSPNPTNEDSGTPSGLYIIGGLLILIPMLYTFKHFGYEAFACFVLGIVGAMLVTTGIYRGQASKK